jgi:uncharacterized protein (DUF1778 family)
MPIPPDDDRDTDQESASEPAFVRMTPHGFDAFMMVIDAPATPVPEVLDLFKRKVPWAACSG